MGPAERLAAAALRQRLVVLFLLSAFGLAGVWALVQLPVEAFPDLTNNQVVVVTEAPGLATTEVEQRITYPIETALMGTPGAEQVRSLSKFGLSLVTVVFADAVPVYFARQLVSERLAEAASRLPLGTRPTLGPVATAFGEIYQYLVEGDGVDLMATKTIHDWEIRTRLRAVAGVSEVNSWGGLTQQYHVVVDPQRLEKYGLGLHEVVEALERNNASFGGGFVEHRGARVTVRGVGLIRDVSDIEQIVLAAVDGVAILVRDVAEVSLGAMPRQGAVTRDGKGEVVAGMVIMLKGENGREVAARVKARVAAIQETLPPGLSIVPFYDQSAVIERTARTVRRNLLEGSLLVVVVLVVFLRDLRAALVVASVIPFAMLSGFTGMWLFGVSANLMSLGAIDFGMVVDGAVVMIENAVRRRREGRPTETEPVPFFTAAAIDVARPILFGVLIIIAVYMPIFTLQGLEGKLYRPMAITVCSALLGALVLALTGVPVLASYVLRLDRVPTHARWLDRLCERYQRHLAAAMDRRSRTLGIAGVIVAVALGSAPLLGTEFMPRLDEGAILIETRRPVAVSLPESVAISTRIEQIVRGFPEVRSVVTKVGRPDLATEAMGISLGDVYVDLHPVEQWTSGRTKTELIDALAAALAAVPGLTVNFTQPMAMRLDEVVSGVKADIALKIFGPDLAVLGDLGERIRARLAGVRGVADLQVEVLSGASQIEIVIDRQAAARYGLNVTDVQELVETAIGGRVATEALDGARRFAVVVRFPEALRSSPEAIASLALTAAGGEKVPVGRIATVRRTEAPEAVTHENGERRLVVQMNARGRDPGSVVADARRALVGLHLPPGYWLDWGGQFENQQRATRRLLVVVPLALAIIFLLLLLTFRRVRQAGLVILNVPFALVGGIAALWVRGLPLSLAASIGFVALFGVAVLNGVVMITAVNGLRERGHALRDAILAGASMRLEPVLMTALVAAFGFVPMALSQGAGAEVQRPLATVVIGGIVTSTLLTLVVLPTVYELIETWAAYGMDANAAHGS